MAVLTSSWWCQGHCGCMFCDPYTPVFYCGRSTLTPNCIQGLPVHLPASAQLSSLITLSCWQFAWVRVNRGRTLILWHSNAIVCLWVIKSKAKCSFFFSFPFLESSYLIARDLFRETLSWSNREVIELSWYQTQWLAGNHGEPRECNCDFLYSLCQQSLKAPWYDYLLVASETSLLLADLFSERRRGGAEMQGETPQYRSFL